jgi:hypothetical protein
MITIEQAQKRIRNRKEPDQTFQGRVAHIIETVRTQGDRGVRGIALALNDPPPKEIKLETSNNKGTKKNPGRSPRQHKKVRRGNGQSGKAHNGKLQKPHSRPQVAAGNNGGLLCPRGQVPPGLLCADDRSRGKGSGGKTHSGLLTGLKA